MKAATDDPHKFDRDRLRARNKFCAQAFEWFTEEICRANVTDHDRAICVLAGEYVERQRREASEALAQLPRQPL